MALPVISRRQLLGGLAASLAAAACGGKRAPSRGEAAARPRLPRPRSLVLITMRGGLDAVMSTNPKRSTEVDATVDVPFSPSENFEVNGNRFGPALKPIEPWLHMFAVVNNIHVGTVRHETGEPQLARLRSRVNPAIPTATDVIGWYREGPPLGAVSIGGRMQQTSSTGALDCTSRRIFSGDDQDLCDSLMALTPDELAHSAEALDQLARADGAPETRRHATDVAAFMRKLAVTPPFREETWIPEAAPAQQMFFGAPRVKFMQRDFQRTLWLLEHELTACVNLGCRELEWDSHVSNIEWQSKMNAVYFPLLARFLDELHRRRNRHGTLASQTMIVMGSELGRHPRLNDHKGKDHFPETALFFSGPNVLTDHGRGAVYGHSGRRLEGLPVSLATGKHDPRGTLPDIDDVGATVMTAFGIDPLAHGYTGRRLPFLVDA